MVLLAASTSPQRGGADDDTRQGPPRSKTPSSPSPLGRDVYLPNMPPRASVVMTPAAGQGRGPAPPPPARAGTIDEDSPSSFLAGQHWGRGSSRGARGGSGAPAVGSNRQGSLSGKRSPSELITPGVSPTHTLPPLDLACVRPWRGRLLADGSVQRIRLLLPSRMGPGTGGSRRAPAEVEVQEEGAVDSMVVNNADNNGGDAGAAGEDGLPSKDMVHVHAAARPSTTWSVGEPIHAAAPDRVVGAVGEGGPGGRPRATADEGPSGPPAGKASGSRHLAAAVAAVQHLEAGYARMLDDMRAANRDLSGMMFDIESYITRGSSYSQAPVAPVAVAVDDSSLGDDHLEGPHWHMSSAPARSSAAPDTPSRATPTPPKGPPAQAYSRFGGLSGIGYRGSKGGGAPTIPSDDIPCDADDHLEGPHWHTHEDVLSRTFKNGMPGARAGEQPYDVADLHGLDPATLPPPSSGFLTGGWAKVGATAAAVAAAAAAAPNNRSPSLQHSPGEPVAESRRWASTRHPPPTQLAGAVALPAGAVAPPPAGRPFVALRSALPEDLGRVRAVRAGSYASIYAGRKLKAAFQHLGDKPGPGPQGGGDGPSTAVVDDPAALHFQTAEGKLRSVSAPGARAGGGMGG